MKYKLGRVMVKFARGSSPNNTDRFRTCQLSCCYVDETSSHTLAYDFHRLARNFEGITHPRGRYQIYTPTNPSAALSENPGRKTGPPPIPNPRRVRGNETHIRTLGPVGAGGEAGYRSRTCWGPGLEGPP